MSDALELHQLTLRMGETTILDDVNWRVAAGTCAAILGPNGSGKSTIARILACHQWPTFGQVFVLGRKMGDVNLAELRQSIRIVQAAGPIDVPPQLTARQVVLTGYFSTIGLYDAVSNDMAKKADQLLRRVGLLELAEHTYSTLSSGEKVRALIARALIVRPTLLLLDEPTAGLDLLAREQVLATVEALFHAIEPSPPTVIMITHHVEELPPATSEILLLDKGRVAASGPPAEVLQQRTLEKVYGCAVKVSCRNGRYQLELAAGAWQDLLNH